MVAGRMSETKRELIAALKAFHNNKDFVVGVVSAVTHENDQRKIIDFIQESKEVTTESILLLAIHLKQNREKTPCEKWMIL